MLILLYLFCSKAQLGKGFEKENKKEKEKATPWIQPSTPLARPTPSPGTRCPPPPLSLSGRQLGPPPSLAEHRAPCVSLVSLLSYFPSSAPSRTLSPGRQRITTFTSFGTDQSPGAL